MGMNEVMVLNDDITFDIKAINNKSLDYDDIIDVEIEETEIQKADKTDYIIACSSGVLTAALDIFWRGSFSLDKANKIGVKEINQFVIKVAQAKGYNGEDLNSAIRFLESLYKIPSDSLTKDFGGGLQHHLRDFAHHPSPFGLMCSIISQFSKYGYGTNTEGHFVKFKFPTEDYIGNGITEKITLGVVTWAYHLVSDMAGSSTAMYGGTGIPGPLLSFFKELSVLPGIRKATMEYNDNDIALSIYISKLFNGTYFKTEGDLKGIRFDFRTEFGIGVEVSKQIIPVLINECLVRSFYFIRRLFTTLSKTHNHLQLSDYKEILPYKDRELTRMLLVSSGVFATLTTASAAAKAFAKKPADKEEFFKNFLLTMNYAGIGRFVFAITADAKYLAEDFNEACAQFKKRHYDKQKDIQELKLECLTLNENQARILYSLKYQMILKDITQTSHEDKKNNKHVWLQEWMKLVLSNTKERDSSYFIDDHSTIKKLMHDELKKENDHWLELIALELTIFHPYYPLGKDNDKKYKGLKYEQSLFENEFCSLQNVISQEDISRMKHAYKKYDGILKNKNKKMIGTIAATATVTVATGGLAWTFAPEIAVMIAGGSVGGLSGAALTSASLALIGGGSLAAGGMGMAGGAAIIAGGGALLGAVSTGAISQSTLIVLSSKTNSLRECAKLLTYGEVVIRDKYHSIEDLADIQLQLKYAIDRIEDYETVIKENETDNKEQKKLLKSIKSTKKYLKKCSNEFSKLINN